ncbi:hypothetical protein FJZ21_03320 [Candidatus Pacearchaeota archaeon]|nr:hypothetical protein [Candidatus Pacearchaeota archaeon]
MNRKGVDFTFSWIFAIIAGAAILGAAIYITTQLIGSSDTQRDTLVAGEVANLLNPIQTNLEDNRYSVINFATDTRVYNECSTQGTFGVQRLSTSSKTRNQWSEESIRKSVYDKYLFSREIEETEDKKLHIMVNPLFAPFKVGDVISIYGAKYCFVNPPDGVEDLINDLSIDGKQDIGINKTNSINDCARNVTSVCFNRIGCDINVNTQSETVTKDGNDMYYEGDGLMFAAIFSDYEIYECQISRLMKRASELGAVYAKKAIYLQGSGCSNNLASDLQSFVLAANVSSSRDFARQVMLIAEGLERRSNELGSCRVF